MVTNLPSRFEAPAYPTETTTDSIPGYVIAVVAFLTNGSQPIWHIDEAGDRVTTEVDIWEHARAQARQQGVEFLSEHIRSSVRSLIEGGQITKNSRGLKVASTQ